MPTLTELAPKLGALVRRGVGLNTRAGAGRFITQARGSVEVCPLEPGVEGTCSRLLSSATGGLLGNPQPLFRTMQTFPVLGRSCLKLLMCGTSVPGPLLP